MNIGKWTAGIDWGRVPLLKTVLCQKGGTLPLSDLTSSCFFSKFESLSKAHQRSKLFETRRVQYGHRYLRFGKSDLLDHFVAINRKFQ